MRENELHQIAMELVAQDNRTTSHPLFCVFEKERIYGMDPAYGGDNWEWLDEECNVTNPEEYGITEEEAEHAELPQKVYYIERDRFVNAHFTMKAAEKYIRENKHNMDRPFVYVSSLHRCDEMITIRDFLKNEGVIDNA